ncbi:MAG: TonB-dependent receptor plug domain-containing protein [Opitutaceae bacterium]|nr:TonB-dependent receptor plug domain-containing protein [Opitutaceae bacterium]
MITSSIPAQTAPLPAPAASADQPVVLETFRVDTSRDRGYVATNSTAGTRLNVAIKDIPLPIEVITREFIDDIGAMDIKEALQYSAGIVQDTVATANVFLFSPSGSGAAGSVSRDSVSITIRGLNTRSFLRNGFRQDAVTDVVNVDRLEVARGPQSLLYGVASLGGIVAITPKYPRATPKTDLRLGFGSNDFHRAELYRTGPIWKGKSDTRSLNYGLGVVYQNQSSRSDFDDRKRLLVTPAVEFRPFRDTNIFVDVEYGRFETKGTGFLDLNDTSAGNLRNRITGQLIAENLNEWGETRAVAKDIFGRDRHFRWGGGDTFAKDDHFSGTVEVTQKLLPGLTLVLGANYSDRFSKNRSINGGVTRATTASAAIAPTAPGAWTNVGSDPVSPGLTQWKTVGYNWGYGETHKYIRQARVDLAYEFTLFGQEQNLLVGRSDQTVRQSQLSTSQASSNTPGSPGQGFLPFTAPSHIRHGGEVARPFRDTVFTEWDTGHYAVYQGNWWKDRLKIIGGWRDERYLVRQYFTSFAKADTSQPDANLANWRLPATPDAASLVNAAGQAPIVNGYRFGAVPQRDYTLTGGISFSLNKDINLYVVSAGGIFPNTGQRDGAANPFNPEKTKSREAGAKFDLWKDQRGRARISATVSYFEIDRENAIYNFAFAPQPRSNNQPTLRAGFTSPANVTVSGAGPNAYSVANSPFTTFQTNRPVTYLLPATYVAAADLGHPRVAGAPQQGGFILVDYASLGTAANDPLRRAMDAAAADPSTNTALQTSAVGTGPAGLQANNAYINRNSDVAYDDRSKGAEAQLYLNFTDNLSTVITYTHLVQAVTGGFKIVDQPRSTEYDSWWRFMRLSTAEALALNLDESKTSAATTGAIGRRTSDVPRNAWAIWNNYKFTEGRLRGFEASLGVTFNGPRQGEQVIDNGLRDRSNDENRRYRPQIPLEYKLNAAIAYRGLILGRKWNLRLNVNNLLDQQKLMSTNTTTLFVDNATGSLVPSTSPLATRITVPNRAIRYFEPLSFRFSASTSF